MSKLLKVVRVEIKEEVTEEVIKSKRHDYVRGGYKIEETIRRVQTATPFALLECGHWRRERGSGPVVSAAKKLSCYQCETEEMKRLRRQFEDSKKPA